MGINQHLRNSWTPTTRRTLSGIGTDGEPSSMESTESEDLFLNTSISGIDLWSGRRTTPEWLSLLEDYERSIHMNTTALLSLLPLTDGVSVENNVYTTGMSKMRDDLLREISNFVMPIGDNNEDDEENVEYADNFSVNLSTSLSVLLLNPNQWWQQKKNNNDNKNTKNSESSRSSGSRSIQNVKERLYQQECERSKEKMKLWREYALILLGHGKNECLTTYETADTDSFFNCLTEILYKISNYVFHNDTNASLVSCESILNHFIHNEIIGNVLDTTISSKGIFNHRFMTAMDSKARIKFMICVRNLPEKKTKHKKKRS